MSGSVYWRLPKPGKPFRSGGSTQIERLEEVFGSLPRRFTHADYERLRAMDVAYGTGGNLFEEIASEVALHGEIEVWVEY